MKKYLYSVVIPAYNEEKYLPQTLKHLNEVMDSATGDGETIVVDNNSTDSTAEIAERLGARVVFEPHNQIGRARNTGALNSTGKYLIFLDADTDISGEIFNKAMSMMVNEDYCGGGVLVSSGAENNILADGIYKLVNFVCRVLRVAPGCFIFCTREGFEAIGGFDEQFYAAEEVWFSRKLNTWGRKKGMKFKIIDNPMIISSPRKMESPLNAFLALVSLALLPLSAFFKPLCWYWYKRPQ